MPSEWVGPWNETLGQVFRTGESRDFRFYLPGPDGNHHFDSGLIPQRTPEGQVTSVLSFTRDVTGTLESLHELEALRYRAILESTDDAIVGKTLDGLVTSWNPAAEAMFGYTASEMLGQSILRLFPGDRLDEDMGIVEGVETLAHGRVLLKMDCHLAQGYGIARPMPGDAVLPWTLRWAAQRAWEQAAPMP